MREGIADVAKKRCERRPFADAMTVAHHDACRRRVRRGAGTRAEENKGLREPGSGGLPGAAIRMSRG